MDWMSLALWALGMWGWAGLPIAVEVKPLYGKAGIATPYALAGCTIEVNELVVQTEHDARNLMLHEVGHCVGYAAWEMSVASVEDPSHSQDPASIMFPYFMPGAEQAILPEDRAFARSVWLQWIGRESLHAITVPVVSVD
jgi:hypothetical protein